MSGLLIFVRRGPPPDNIRDFIFAATPIGKRPPFINRRKTRCDQAERNKRLDIDR